METLIMNKVLRPELPLSSFLWDKQERSLTAEASDFGPCRDGFWWLLPAVEGSDDDYTWTQGQVIKIRSEASGNLEVFRLESKDVRDGDLLALRFRAVNPKCKVRTVTIFND